MNEDPGEVRSGVVSRRHFLHSAAAGAFVIMTPRIVTAAPAKVTIEEPFDGAILNKRHGQITAEGLKIRVTGTAPMAGEVMVNGQAARRTGNRFFAEVVLSQKVTEIIAVGNGAAGRVQDRVRVVWDRNSQPRYRFMVDDNIFFLRDIARKRYASLFDCFYLKILRDLHRKYGARFSVNIYYAEDDFTLPQFPDRYKSEWKDNADWLKLAFHAYANKPDRPYQDAPAEKLIADHDLVVEQILRFAGAETMAPPTNIHWAMVRPEALKPLHQRGVRVLDGYFIPKGDGWDINYNLDPRRSEYLNKHGLWMDFANGIAFVRTAIVINGTPLERIVPTLDPLACEPEPREVVSLLTHEQYFWPFYTKYIPDHAQRCEAAVRWATEHGYKPVFLHEDFLGRVG